MMMVMLMMMMIMEVMIMMTLTVMLDSWTVLVADWELLVVLWMWLSPSHRALRAVPFSLARGPHPVNGTCPQRQSGFPA